MRPKWITFTGIDDVTPVEELIALAAVYPCEFGILYGTNRGGRYAYPGTIREIVDRGKTLRFSAHLCGKAVTEVYDGKVPDLVVPASRFARFQLNAKKAPPPVNPKPEHIGFALTLVDKIGIPAIIQCGAFPLDPVKNVSWLFDRSGGQGLSPKEWPHYTGNEIVGYAGGISPLNISDVISSIKTKNYWLDCETRIRTNDRFDVNKCREILRKVYG